MGLSASKGREPTEEECQQLKELQGLSVKAWEETQHVESLRAMWKVIYPELPFERESWRWKKVGFQREDPSTDFRGGGELALRSLAFYILQQPQYAIPHLQSRRRPDNTENHDGPVNENPIFMHYPWAASAVNVTRLLTSLAAIGGMTVAASTSDKYRSTKAHCWHLLTPEPVFHEVWCIVFRLLDRIWDQMEASYMVWCQSIRPSILPSCRLPHVQYSCKCFGPRNFPSC